MEYKLTPEVVTTTVLILADSYITDVRGIKRLANVLEKLRDGEVSVESDFLEEIGTTAQELSMDAAKALSGIASIRREILDEGWYQILAEHPGLKALDDDLNRFQALTEMMGAGLPAPEDAESHPVFKFGEDV
jgi:hypothetical protein